MTRLALRFASVLILALMLAPAASAIEVYTFSHFAETSGSGTAKSFDSVLYLTTQGTQTYTCWIDLRDKNNQRLKVNGREVCPVSPIPFCTFDFNGVTRFSLQEWIAYAAQGSTWTPQTLSGSIYLRCSQPLSGLNATLYVTNYHEDAFTAAFAVDHGKILP